MDLQAHGLIINNKETVKKKLLAYFLFSGLLSQAQEYEYNYTFFTNSLMSENYFFSYTTSHGNSSVRNINNKLPVDEHTYHTPGNGLLLQYKNAPGGKWSAAVFRKQKRGMDHFKKATILSFWVYRDFYNLTMHELPQVQLMKQDSTLTSAFRLRQIGSNKWEQIKLPLTSLSGFNSERPDDFIGIVF